MWLVIGLMLLFIVSSVSPMVFGYDSEVSEEDTLTEYYDSYDVSEINKYEQHICKEYYEHDNFDLEEIINPTVFHQLLAGPMDLAWPMYCHDLRHTGRSPYSTVDNHGTEKWRFDTIEWACGSPVIDVDSVIYIGSNDLWAIYPNGTLKWKYDIPHKIVDAPAINEEGVIYFGTIQAMPNYLYAIYTSNGTLKWKYQIGDHIYSSPAIGNDGTIYFGSEDDYIYALYPNGTLKWKYLTGVAVYSSPAIGDDGTVYCGSHDTYLYALYPNNGTLKWKYKTGNWIRTAPCIADDGTIYVVSLDNCLHAVNPDGTQKWITYMGEGGTSPTLGQDGTIYAGYNALRAINPTNGSVKWTFDPGPDRTIQGGTPCNSVDGIIYFGTHIGEYDGGELIAVNPDGTERWRIMLATDWIDSAPAIGKDGTVYVGSCNDGYHPGSWGYLHAIGPPDPDAPSAPQINGQTSIKPWRSYEYTFNSTSPLGRDVYYYIDWGDNTVKDWFGPFDSGEEVKVSHTWYKRGTYIIKARAKDSDDLLGPWGELKVTTPKDKVVNFNNLLLKLVEQFPFLERLSYIFS
jgi:outer membrane protein assembly factor BamB